MKNAEQIKTDPKQDIKQLERSIGARIRLRRTELGLTQLQLARQLGLSYQQIQKYETGLNRISAGRLHQISKLLFIDTTYFYKGLGEEGENTTNKVPRIPTLHLEGRNMDKNVQRAIANLVSVMGSNGDEG